MKTTTRIRIHLFLAIVSMAMPGRDRILPLKEFLISLFDFRIFIANLPIFSIKFKRCRQIKDYVWILSPARVVNDQEMPRYTELGKLPSYLPLQVSRSRRPSIGRGKFANHRLRNITSNSNLAVTKQWMNTLDSLVDHDRNMRLRSHQYLTNKINS